MPEVTPAFELGLNAVTHCIILYCALTFLFMVLISKTEHNALQGEVRNALNTNLNKALEAGNASSGGKLKEMLRPLDGALSVVEHTVQRPDEATKVYNDGLFMNAYLIIGVFLTTLLVMLLVMAYGAGVSVRKTMLIVQHLIE